MDLWAGRVVDAVLPALAASVEAREDAKETPLEKFARVGSRPANDAVGTTSARAAVRESLIRVKQSAQDAGKRQTRLVDTIAGKVDAHNAQEFKRVIGIDAKQLSASISNDIETFRAENVDLITSIPETLLDQVSTVVDEAWSKGLRVEELRDQILKRFDVAKSRADLIARDQTLKLNAKLAATRVQSAGITRYEWSTSQDERVRGNPAGKYPNPSKTGRVVADHFHLNGKTFRYDDPPVVNEANGDRANPGEDYQCRCTAAPILDFLEGLGDDEIVARACVVRGFDARRAVLIMH